MNTGPARSGNVAATLVGAPIVPAAPTSADKPATAAAPPPANRFAELLRRNRAEAPTPAAPAPARAPLVDSSGSCEAGDPSAIETQAAPTNAAKARAATPKVGAARTAGDSKPASEPSDAACHDDGTTGGSDSDSAERAATTTAPADRLDARAVSPAAIDALHRLASAASAASDDATGVAGEHGDASAAPGAATTSRLGHARGMASVDAANDRHASAVDASRDSALRIAADAGVQVAPGETYSSFDSRAATRAHERAIDALSASLGIGSSSPLADPAVAPTAPTALALSTPIDAPDFAAALGVRISVLVQDGVQRAELHLNPAETGPVSIHITLDGTAARVDFGADVAATRAAIERGLPELASALRDAGFTLAGGGVSQHAGGRASGEDEAARSAARPDGNAGAAAIPVSADSRTVVGTVTAGGVDLYA